MKGLMAKTPEHYDLAANSAVADLTGKRLGRVAMVLKAGTDSKLFRIRWEDGEMETLARHGFLTRYTTESRGYYAHGS